jgi:hypothetical protein
VFDVVPLQISEVARIMRPCIHAPMLTKQLHRANPGF